MLVEQALSWLGHVQNTAHKCSHDKDYTNEMDRLFQTSYRNFARMRDVCVETGVEISTLIANASTSKASWKCVQLSTRIAFTTPPLEPTCPLSVCACSDALWRMVHGSVEPCARRSSARLQAVQQHVKWEKSNSRQRPRGLSAWPLSSWRKSTPRLCASIRRFRV